MSLFFNLRSCLDLIGMVVAQACEVHLASLEKDLEKRRVQAVRDGLGGRCRALVECAWVWEEVEKEGLRALKGELVL
jgi:hypothetical protein